jgi:uncharacterized protein (TIGR00304 family)
LALENEKVTDAGTLYAVGTGLILIGVVVIIAVVLVSFSHARREGNSKAGGAVIIGPLPIVFGTDRESLKTVLLLSIALTALLIIAMAFYYLMFR